MNRRNLAFSTLMTACCFFVQLPAEAQLLTTLEHHVVGAQLKVEPSELYVPKDIPGSLSVSLVSAEGASPTELNRLRVGTHVEAVLRGPAFPAYRLLALPDEPLWLPPIALVGEYRIDDIRLVDTASGDVLMMGNPSSVAVHVFPDVLVSQVESRPLTLDEIAQRGIVIDADTFTAVEFEVIFMIEGRPFPVFFPVVTPKFKSSTEIIDPLELKARLAEAERINRTLASIDLPEQLRIPNLNLQLHGINFEAEIDGEEDKRELPHIPALVVIPGSIGFLNQFFSVQVFTSNASPLGSRLSVHSLSAEITLPNGKDMIPNSADDPLRLARTVDEPSPPSTRPVVTPGSDGQWGTAGAESRLDPGRTGRAEFLVEGRKPGLHYMEFKLRGILDGFAGGEIPIEGHAIGSVLVRNPKFSIVFSHPRTIRAGEPYTAAVTILNTSEVEANLVSVNLNSASISGATLDVNQPERIELGTIAPGESATAVYHLIAQRTGDIAFANLTGDDDITGRFDLTMGIDERGVPLSSGVIGYPDWVQALPPELMHAADRVLGQALSVATAATLPPGVRSLEASLVKTRVVELAEAAQRLEYGDAPEAVYLDLLLDWHGGRVPSLGFDQILRRTNAGAAFRTALMNAVESAASTSGLSWASLQSSALAGRGERWALASTSDPSIEPQVSVDGVATNPSARELTESGTYLGSSGWILPIRDLAARPGTVEVTFTVPPASVGGQASWMIFDGAGGGSRIELSLASNPSSIVCYRYFPFEDPQNVVIDTGCDRASDGILVASAGSISESPPTMINVVQDLLVRIGRPYRFCAPAPTFQRFGRTYFFHNYGTQLAVLFSKPMSREAIEAPGAFRLDNGVASNGVKLQPGGRVALVNLRNGVTPAIPRTLITSNVVDERGNGLVQASLPINASSSEGVSIRGRVLGVDGSPVANVPVTLTMHDRVFGDTCYPIDIRVSQVRTDTDGRFTFDYVMAGLDGYTIAATDTRGMNQAAVDLVLEASPNGYLDPAELGRLLRDPDALAELVAQYNGSYDTAIAAVEGVDRATFRDHIAIGGPRIGSEVPVALRFRGRGTVVGTVYASDGVTPVSGAAVNLFPDATSRELGRGVFSAQNGSFVFRGVPIGPFTLSGRTSIGQQRAVAGILTEPNEIARVDIVLTSTAVPMGSVAGTVYESDGITPAANAQVFVSEWLAVYGAGIADADGAFRIDRVPARTYDIAALSFDGSRIGWRRNLTVQADATTYATIVLPTTSQVVGRVELANGQPVPGALVAGGEAIVTTDAGGNFVLNGVPIGTRTIAAGVEPNAALGIFFTKLGSEQIEVLPGVVNYAIIRLNEAGSIRGTVVDANGSPVGNVRVAIPQAGGFLWVNADAAGAFRFDNLPLGSHVVSAPSPPVRDPDAAWDSILSAGSSPSIEQLQAALTNILPPAYSAPDAGTFNPGSWGFARTRLDVDGQVQTVNVHYLPEGTVSGRVQNANSVPVAADVTLIGAKPGKNGGPTVGTIATLRSDPATGDFSFPSLRRGPWRVSAKSPFYPAPAWAEGETTDANLDVTGLVLQFPPTSATGGRLTGLVLRDGQPLPGARVAIDYTADYEIMTQADGTFDTQIDLPRGKYEIRVFDPNSSRTAMKTVWVEAGSVTFTTIELLVGGGSLEVNVLQISGAPADGAQVNLRRAAYPAGTFQGTTNATGQVSFSNLWEGDYSVLACWLINQTNLCRTRAVQIAPGSLTSVTLTLDGTGTIAGTYVEADGVTPVGFAQISIKDTAANQNIAFTTTDGSGAFSIDGIPLGTFELTARNAVTGRAAIARAVLSHVGQTVQVTLREDLLGEVAGTVIGSDGMTPAPRISVTITPSSPLFPSVTVTSDPLGQFLFPGVPPGDFILDAVDPLDSTLRGRSTGVMTDSADRIEVDVALERRAHLTVNVLNADGTPATNAFVQMQQRSVDTDGNGQARFTGLILGSSIVRAQSRQTGQTHSSGSTTVSLVPGENLPITIRLSGVGGVDGTVTNAQGAPVAGAEVVLVMRDGLTFDTVNTLTAADGSFSFDDVILGEVRATATLGALAGSATGSLSTDGQRITLDIQLGPSADVHGYIVRADGVSPLSNTNVTILYDAPSGAAGAAVVRTDITGHFSFDAIPEGPFTLRADAPFWDAVLYHPDAIPPGVTDYDLGTLLLDEDRPQVISLSPADGASGVASDTTVAITFSEPMDPLVTDTGGVYLTDGISRVPASLAWSPDTRTLVLTPDDPLASETTYTLVVTAGEIINLGSGGVSRGPVDLAQRPLDAPVVSIFTTRDSIPPTIDSFTPLANAEQVAIDASIRVSFSEPMDPGSIQLTLTGPSGNVPGTLSIALNQRVATFTPTNYLSPNANYVASLTSATDLAGNAAVGLPQTNAFATIDTLGPNVIDLAVANGGAFAQGANVAIEATLAQSEPNVQIQLTSDLSNYFSSSPGSLIVSYPVTGPPGALILFARGIDRFGNFGPWYQETFTIVPNNPPQVAIVQLAEVLTDTNYSFRIDASDDSGIARVQGAVQGAFTAGPIEASDAPLALTGLVPADIGPGQSITITGEAEDNSGVVVQAAPLVVAVGDGTDPTISLSSQPTWVDPGTSIAIDATATDNFAVTSLMLQVSGAFTYFDGGAITPATSYAQTFTFQVPSHVPPFATFHANVIASDAASNTGNTTVTFRVNDTVPPTVVSLSPSDDATNVPVSTQISVIFSEDVTVPAGAFSLIGPSGTVPTTLSQTGAIEYHLTPLTELQNSTSYQVVLTSAITDGSGNPLAPVTTSFMTTASDVHGPRLLSISPADNSINLSLRPTIQYDFDEAIDPLSIAASDLVLEAEVGGAITPTTLSRTNGGRTLRFVPTQTLRPGTNYLLRLAGTPTDAAGNPLRDLGGQTFTELVTRFTTARIDLTVFGTDRVVEGHGALAQIVAESSAPISSALWFLDSIELGTSSGPVPMFNLPIPTLAIQPSAITIAGANVTIPAAGDVAVDDVSLTIEPASGDFDQDGLSNGIEMVYGTNPWIADATLDLDGDGHTNAEEIARGTSPSMVDTDADGIYDPNDPHPLVGNRRPGAGVIAGSHLSFTTAGQGLELPAATRIQPPFTFEAWVYPSATGTVFDSGSGQPLDIAYDDPSSTFRFTLNTLIDGPSSWTAAITSARDQWHHVAVVYDGVVFRAFVDGQLAASAARTGSIAWGATTTRVGSDFRGRIDEIRLWNIPRSAESLQRTMHRVVAAVEPGLFASWRLDDGTGTIAEDETSHGYDATLTAPNWTTSSLAPVHRDEYLQLAGTQVILQLAASDLDNDPLTYVVTRLPENGRLFEHPGAQGAEITAVPATVQNAQLQLLYVPNPGAFGIDRVEYHVNDTHFDSLTASYVLDTPVSKTWIGGDASAPNDWFTANNWIPPAVPAPDESVLLPAGSTVVLSANTAIRSLTIAAGSILDLGASQLEIFGDLTNDGSIQGTGAVVLSGVNSEVRGELPNLDVNGDIALSGDVTVAGSVRLLDPARLDIGPHLLSISGDLEISAALVMTDPMGIVDVAGALEVTAGCSGGQPVLTAGYLVVGGDYTVGDCDGSDAIQPSGTHTVTLDGNAPQTVTVPNSSLTNSYFRNLIISNTSGVTLATPILVTGTLTIAAGASVAATGLLDVGELAMGMSSTLSATDRLDIQGSAVLSEGAQVTAGVLEDSANFTLAPGATVTATQLELNTDGDASTPVSFTHMSIGAHVVLTEPLVVSGNLEIRDQASLDVGGHSVEVGADLTVSGSLRMNNPADVLRVDGNALFGPAPVFCTSVLPSSLTAGTMRFRGNLLQNCANGFGTFNPGPDTLIVFDGSGPQAVLLNTNFLGDLEFVAGSQVSYFNDAGSLAEQVTLGTGASVNVVSRLNADTLVLGANATLTGQNIGIGDSLTTALGSSISAVNLLSSVANPVVDGSITATNLTLNGAATSIPPWSFQNLTINTAIDLPGDHLLPNLTIGSSGVVTVSGWHLTVLGDLTVSGALRMTTPTDEVEVFGNATFGGTNCNFSNPSTLSDGMLRLRGNFSQSNCQSAFVAAPTHTTSFEGSGLQTIALQYPATSRFGSVQVADSAQASITANAVIDGAMTLGSDAIMTATTLQVSGAMTLAPNASFSATTLELQDDLTTAASSSLSLTTSLTLNPGAAPAFVVDGALTVPTVILDGAIGTIPALPYGALTVRAPVSMSADVDVSGTLTISQQDGGALTVAGHRLTVGGLAAIGPLHMTDPADEVIVLTGLADFGFTGCSELSPSTLTAGTLRLRGDFFGLALRAFTCTNAFVPTAGHRTIFEGSGNQGAWLVPPNQFSNLEIAAGVTFASVTTSVLVENDLFSDGTITVATGQTFTINGALQLGASGIINNSGTVTVTQDPTCPVGQGTTNGPLTCP